MENNFEKIIDIIIAFIIFFVFPLLYFSQRQVTLTQQVVSTEVNNFVSTVNSHGVVTKNMYNDLIDKLHKTNNVYDIKLEHRKLALEPEYRFRTADEIIDEQNKAYNGTNTYHYFPVSTQLPVVYETDNSGLVMNTDTNESILARAIRTPAASGHNHTSDCYVGGHIHGSNIIMNGHVHKEDCYCPGHVVYEYGSHGELSARCNVCSTPYNSYEVSEGQSCTKLKCGFTNGQHYNCYSPKIYFDLNGTTISLYCSECGKMIYNFILMGYGSSQYLNIQFGSGSSNMNKNSQINIPNSDPSFAQYKEEYNILYNKISECLSNTDSFVINDGYIDGYVPACQLTFRLPYVGYFEECPVCNDYMVRKGWNTDNLELYCMKCKQVILGTTYNYTTHKHSVNYYSNNHMITPEYNSDESEAIYQRLYNIWDTGAASCKKVFYECGFSGSNWSTPTYTTISIDEPLFNYPLVASHLNHGCTYNAGKNTYCGFEGELKCNEIVKSIAATNPVQTVYVGEPLITTAIATYQDGSTGVVLCNADFIPLTIVKDKIVTLSYVNIKNQTLTCTMKVTVIPKNKMCENGHLYNLNNDGTDPGCPYCRAWLKSLVIYNPAGSSLTIYRGTTLKENGVVLYATYFDGHTEYVETGYSDNLDKYYVGIQNVTISYKGKNVSLTVITKRNIVQCPVCHHYYELYPDDTDPGCPYCKARTPIFTGNVLKYYSDTFQNEILKELNEGSGRYYFKAGDYFSVKLSNKTKTLGTKVLGFILPDLPQKSIFVECGGTIREDMDGNH